MLREINSQVLVNLKITAHQFIIMMLVLNEYWGHLEEYLKASNSYENLSEDLKYLADKSFLTYDSSNPHNYKSIVVQPPFMKAIGKDDRFDELYLQYPTRITRPDGSVDYLRKDRRHCEQIYSIITKGSQDVHDHIMSCLRAELDYRHANGTINYMKRLGNWLSKREWENFEDIVANNIQIKEDNNYGTALE
jgi:hypothetical protein